MSRKGKIQTVRNVIDPIDLGMTMTHEHLLIEFPDTFSVPPEESHRNQQVGACVHRRSSGGAHRRDQRPRSQVSQGAALR